jgi:hypothetical protein
MWRGRWWRSDVPNHPYYKSPHWLDLRRAALERARYRCEVPGCHANAAHGRLYVDHKSPRPYSDGPTSADTLDNLRVLCETHDQQIRQTVTGYRRNGGRLSVPGCDASGNPTDPQHPWNRPA